MNNFPKILHQIWLQGEDQIPENFKEFSSKWKDIHPNYEYKFWDANNIEELLVSDYPEYIDHWFKYTGNLHRSDYARIFILHKYGGIYTDFDSYPLKNIDGLFDEVEVNYSTPVDMTMVKNTKNINEYNIVIPTREVVDKLNNIPFLNNSTIISIPNYELWFDFIKINRETMTLPDHNYFSLVSYSNYIMKKRKEGILDKILLIPYTYLNSQFLNPKYNQYVIHTYNDYKNKK
jgi:hypothetical protein